MHEPATCGALPAQQASSHIDPDADAEVSSGTVLDRHATSSIRANTDLALRTIVDLIATFDLLIAAFDLMELRRFIGRILAHYQKIRKA